MPLISVVIPLYNKAPYIVKTIQSVLHQTFDDFEVVIVDDGSTDHSAEVVWQHFNSEKIRLIEKKNGGPSSARNRGVQEAKGSWIVFLDADDFLLPDALAYFASLLEKGRDYYICNYYIKEGNEIKLFSKVRKYGDVKDPFYLEAVRDLTERAGSAIIKKELLLDHPFNEQLRRYEDAEWQYQAMRQSRVFVSPVPVMISDRDATAAACARENIDEDFIGHLDFKDKCYWEQMSLYLLALECKYAYPQSATQLYGKIYKRIDLRLGYLYIRIRNLMVHRMRDLLYHEKVHTFEELMSNVNDDENRMSNH